MKKYFLTLSLKEYDETKFAFVDETSDIDKAIDKVIYLLTSYKKKDKND